jgi:hypothetical protein
MTEILQCPKCLEQFKAQDLKHERCPDCDRWLEPAEAVQQKIAEESAASRKAKNGSPRTEQGNHERINKSDADLDDLIDAQDRTTYAIRSLALYLFITITTSTIGAVLMFLYPNTIFGVGTIFLGFLAAIVIGVSELSRSRP